MSKIWRFHVLLRSSNLDPTGVLHDASSTVKGTAIASTKEQVIEWMEGQLTYPSVLTGVSPVLCSVCGEQLTPETIQPCFDIVQESPVCNRCLLAEREAEKLPPLSIVDKIKNKLEQIFIRDFDSFFRDIIENLLYDGSDLHW